MSERAISVGDIVQIVRQHCPHPSLGVPFTVERIGFGKGQCVVCREWCHVGRYAQGDGWSVPFKYLKRFDPPAELESARTDEPMKEPV